MKGNVFSGLLACCMTWASWASETVPGDDIPEPVQPTAEHRFDETLQDGEAEDPSYRYRFLPIPIFITEPAIGNGLGVALTMFHPVQSGKADAPRVTTPASIGQMDDEKEPPPVITSVFGAYTTSKTWAAGIGHMNNWRDDSIRYAGALGLASVNSEIFVFRLPLEFNLDGVLLYQDIKFRVGESDFFVGAGLSYLDADIDFGLGSRPQVNQGVPTGFLDAEIKNVGLALRGFYDTRNNLLDPVSGQLFELSAWRYDDFFGGRYDYWSGKVKALSFHNLRDKFVLGLRLEAAAVSGRLPFFAYPWVKLRGIPALRYQNKFAGSVEAELRYLLAPKWQVLGFAGWGYTSDDIPFFENPDSIYNFGFGGRYQVLESHKVWMGVDVARGPEEWAWYVQVGHPW